MRVLKNKAVPLSSQHCRKYKHNFFFRGWSGRSAAQRQRMSPNVPVQLMDCFSQHWPWPLSQPFRYSISSLSFFHPVPLFWFLGPNVPIYPPPPPSMHSSCLGAWGTQQQCGVGSNWQQGRWTQYTHISLWLWGFVEDLCFAKRGELNIVYVEPSGISWHGNTKKM